MIRRCVLRSWRARCSWHELLNSLDSCVLTKCVQLARALRPRGGQKAVLCQPLQRIHLEVFQGKQAAPGPRAHALPPTLPDRAAHLLRLGDVPRYPRYSFRGAPPCFATGTSCCKAGLAACAGISYPGYPIHKDGVSRIGGTRDEDLPS